MNDSDIVSRDAHEHVLNVRIGRCAHCYALYRGDFGPPMSARAAYEADRSSAKGDFARRLREMPPLYGITK